MDFEMNKKVSDLLRRSVRQSDLRVCLVISMLSQGHFDSAVEQSLPLVGTPHSPWFLYARAWQCLSQGRVAEADRLLSEALEAMEEFFPNSQSDWTGFTFTQSGKPRICPPFNTPLKWDPFSTHLPGEYGHLSFPVTMFTENWPGLLSDISKNIREYKKLFRSVALQIERVLHHGPHTVSVAISTMEIRGAATDVSQFLNLATMTENHLQMTADTLWRVAADWSDFLDLVEVTSYLYYLLDDEQTALSLANRGLKKSPSSNICGNVRALILNKAGCSYLADEQWGKLLRSRPDSSVTYLVLGNQALLAGGHEAALRYFQEAHLVGDNCAEAESFFSAALECL